MIILLFCLWVIFNGRINGEIMIFGIVLTAALFWFLCRFLNYSMKKELRLYQKVPYILLYGIVLMSEIIKSNIQVSKLIISPKYEVVPVMLKFKPDLKSETLRVILANSITLTPGTISVSLKEDYLVIHCLDEDFAKDIGQSKFIKILKKLEA